MPVKWDAECRWIVLAALLCGMIAGCSKHSPTSPPATGGEPPMAQSSSDEFDTNDPCSLLEPKEVEAVLGAPLAVPPFRASNGAYNPRPDGSLCIYETAKFRYISLEVEYTGGAQSYSMMGGIKNIMKGTGSAEIANNVKKNFKLDDGTEISGEWDEASLMPMNCCIFAAVRADQLITIDFTASPATLRDAAGLVDSAYKRIDHPLKIDGGAAVTAAKALDKTRPKQVDVCSLLTRAEVEAILGTLSADPSPAGKTGCDFVLPAHDNVRPQYGIQIFWTGGYSRWRTDHHVRGIGRAAVNQTVIDVTGHPLPGTSADDPDAKAAAGGSEPNGGDPAETVNRGLLGGFAVVKRDVLVQVNGGFTDPLREKALLAAVLQKI